MGKIFLSGECFGEFCLFFREFHENFSSNTGVNTVLDVVHYRQERNNNLGVGTKRATTHSHAASNVRDVHTVHVQQVQDHHCRTTGNPSILFPVAFSRSRIKIDFGIGIMECQVLNMARRRNKEAGTGAARPSVSLLAWLLRRWQSCPESR